MIVADTDVISVLDAGRGPDFDRLRPRVIELGIVPLVSTIVTFEEQVRGWLSYIASSRRLEREIEGYRRLQRLVQTSATRTLLPFDEPAVARFELLKKKRIRVGTMDLKIASIALAYDLPLATRNVRDFGRVPGLKLLNGSK